MACTSALVVLLPLVPPTATIGAVTKRDANSSSPITATPAERACLENAAVAERPAKRRPGAPA